MGRRPPAEPFHARVERSLRDTFLRVAVPAATRRFHLTRRHALAELGEPLRWRQLARAIRAHTIANLDLSPIHT
ncbi:MAG: hypothetical protein DIU84_06455 [Bacillota bacterium]|nr:MAG: hypothetical protein DIU84_06455 [Bacillota bacterium]